MIADSDHRAGTESVEFARPLIPSRTRDKVCIVGFADGHRHLAPFNDDSYEFWGINRLHVVLPDKPMV